MIVVFAGTPAFAVPSLRALVSGPHRVAAVYTRPDRPAGRRRRVVASPVKEVACALGLTVEQPESFRCRKVHERLAAYRPDLMVVAAYGLILPPEALAVPRAGCINVHASVLPRWRGAAPVQRAILAGDTQTGVTIMQMDTGVDTGGVLLSRVCDIRPEDTGGSLTERLARLGAGALDEALDRLAGGRLEPRPQDDSAATVAPKIGKSESLIDWSRDARYLERMVRAFLPSPVAYTWCHGERLRILGAEALGGEGAAAPGTIVRAEGDGIDVQAGSGRLRLLELQRPGRRAMSAAQFLHGRALAPGLRLGG